MPSKKERAMPASQLGKLVVFPKILSYLDILIILGKGNSTVNIVSYKLSAAYFIAKLLAVTILDNDQKICNCLQQISCAT